MESNFDSLIEIITEHIKEKIPKEFGKIVVEVSFHRGKIANIVVTDQTNIKYEV